MLRALLEGHDGRALKLVVHGDNEGLSAARNRGFLEARAPLVLLLDADDELLPHGPAALIAALEADPEAAFAYGMLARVGLEREDLLGTAPWDPALFRHGNYVPVTCSLVRRSAWELVGGYSAEGLLELGWEDMDFWLRLAAAGQHARPRAAHRRHLPRARRVDEHRRRIATPPRSMAFLRERHPAPDGRRMTPDELLTHLEAELARCRDERDRLRAELEATRGRTRSRRARDGCTGDALKSHADLTAEHERDWLLRRAAVGARLEELAR